MNYFYVYILKCSDQSYYVGHTDNIEKRIAEHKLGICSDYTSRRRPINIVFLEKFQTRDEAFTIERRIKGWTRKKKEALIAGDWNKIKELSNQKKIYILRQAYSLRLIASAHKQDERKVRYGKN